MDLTAEVSTNFTKGTVSLLASAIDSSGDPIFYTFRIHRDVEEQTAGPQEENTAMFEVGIGPWTVTVTVDDDPICSDSALDSSCSLDVDLPHIDFLMWSRGDVDGSGSAQITDAIRILNFLFQGSPRPVCLAAADVNTDGAVDMSDGIFLLNLLFANGRAPDRPFPRCGFSEYESDYLLGCEGAIIACP